MADEIKSDYVKIWVTSFNMAAKTLEFEKLEEQKSVHKRISETVPDGYDVYVCGAQELVDEKYFTIIDRTLKKRGFRRTSTTTARVSGRGDGSFLSSKHTTIAIFISNKYKDKIKVRKCYSCSLGLMEGSKGAASLLLDVEGTTVAFLCCHLSSKLPKDKQKNYRKMIQDVGALGDKHFSILSQVHHVVVFGDLNYRIRKISAERVLHILTKDGSSKRLWQYDTLKKDINTKKAFANFREPRPRLDFLPTYKKKPNRTIEIKRFKDGKLDFKSGSSWLYEVYRIKYKEPMYKGGKEQDRIPSFTDRLVVHSMPTRRNLCFEEDSKPYLFQNISNPDSDNYGCIFGLTFSDHTPIYAGLRLSLPHLMRRPPWEFDGEKPKAYRLQLKNINVKLGDKTKHEIKSIRTLFPLHYENSNDECLPSLKFDFTRTSLMKEEEQKSQLPTPPAQPAPKSTIASDHWNSELPAPSTQSALKNRCYSRGDDMLTLEDMLRDLAENSEKREYPPIELVYCGPESRDMFGNLHCLVKITLTDGRELEGCFEVLFSDFDQNLIQSGKPCKKAVRIELFLQGRKFGQCHVDVVHDFVSKK